MVGVAVNPRILITTKTNEAAIAVAVDKDLRRWTEMSSVAFPAWVVVRVTEAVAEIIMMMMNMMIVTSAQRAVQIMRMTKTIGTMMSHAINLDVIKMKMKTRIMMSDVMLDLLVMKTTTTTSLRVAAAAVAVLQAWIRGSKDALLAWAAERAMVAEDPLREMAGRDLAIVSL